VRLKSRQGANKKSQRQNLGFDDELFYSRSLAICLVYVGLHAFGGCQHGFLRDRKKLSGLLGQCFELPPRMIGPGFEKLCRGFCVRQFLHKFKVRLSVGPCELDHLGIVFLRACNGRRVGVSQQITRFGRSSTHVFKCFLGLRGCLTNYLCAISWQAGGFCRALVGVFMWIFLRAVLCGPPNKRPSARIG
jgi:hypothetical protein